MHRGKRHRGRIIAITIALFAALITNLFLPAIPQVNAVRAAIDSRSLLELHNQQRVENGLDALGLNPVLNNSASKKAQAMLDTDCWSHYCPDGKSPWEFVIAEGYDYLFAGENLAEGFYNNSSVMQAWMDSTSHRNNILNSNFTEIGFGFARGEFQGIENNVVVVVHFGTPDLEDEQSFTSSGSNFTIPEILSPTENSHYNQPDVEVYGKSDLEQVKLFLAGFSEREVPAIEGIFTYKYQNLNDGEYVLTSQGISGSQASEISSPRRFTIDTKPDKLRVDDFEIINSAWTNRLTLTRAGLLEIKLTSDDGIQYMQHDGDFQWYIDMGSLANSGRVEVTTIDLAGNTASNNIDLSEVTTSFNSRLVPDLSIRQWLNIGIIIAIIVLMLVDIYRRRHEEEDMKQHWHIGILLIMVIFLLLNNIAGEILTGLST